MPKSGLGPRQGQSVEKPGSYQIVVRLDKSVVDPGEELIIEVFIVGYGDIRFPRIAFYPSTSFFDQKSSFCLFGVEKTTDDKIVFGGQKAFIDPVGNSLNFSGISAQGWSEPTLFIDDPKTSPPRVVTETKQRNAPVEIHLAINKRVRPGRHSVSIAFRFFNGEHWQSMSHVADFQIRNFIQRHEGLAWLVS